MAPPQPPSRMPSVQDPATLGIGNRAGVRDMYADSIEGEGVPKFFRNIGRAFKKVWNQPMTSSEKAFMKPVLAIAKPVISTAMPEIAPVANIAIDEYKQKYGVGLYAGARPRGSGMCMGDRKVKQYIKRA